MNLREKKKTRRKEIGSTGISVEALNGEHIWLVGRVSLSLGWLKREGWWWIWEGERKDEIVGWAASHRFRGTPLIQFSGMAAAGHPHPAPSEKPNTWMNLYPWIFHPYPKISLAPNTVCYSPNIIFSTSSFKPEVILFSLSFMLIT